MKIFTAAAVAILLSSGIAFAQDNTTTGATTGAASGAGGATGGANADGGGNYLTGNGPGQFYTDELMTTMRTEAEMKSAWQAMSEEDRANASSLLRDRYTRWRTLCNSLGTM